MTEEDILLSGSTEESQTTPENYIEDFDVADDNFEEGDSLVGEKYVAPAKDEKFIDVHKGTVIDKKDVSPLLQIKAFFESTNTKYREPRSGCGKCYGRGYTGFNTTTQAWIPCRCMSIPQTENERKEEGKKFERNLQNVYALKNFDKWEKITKTKLIHNKMLELLKNGKSKEVAGIGLSASPIMPETRIEESNKLAEVVNNG